MAEPIIKVENLGKKYTLSHLRGNQELSFREMITDNFKKIANPKRLFQSRNKKEEFWALKDVNFDVAKGERVGIIGRNGAGKSTLLKVLSRITDPTEGKITIKGRVASLLEVGTGFHPELTGRENIYLNGAILGMSRREIKRKFSEIVEFAEVEKFLDTPVKRYSSGMYVRLAFAVAAHLDPEILIVDEVLAVGDAAFQKKCLGKMEEVSRGEGRTVLFVSHNMGMIQSLCQKGIILKEGHVDFIGSVSDALKTYSKELARTINSVSIAERKRNKQYDQWAKITNLEYESDGNDTNSKQKLVVNLEVESDRDTEEDIAVGIWIKNYNQQILYLHSLYQNKLFALKKGKNTFKCVVDPTFLTGGEYYLCCGIYSHKERKDIDRVEEALDLKIKNLDPFGFGTSFDNSAMIYYVPYEWQKTD